MVATLIYAGLRREEPLWLTPDDIDWKAGKFGLIRVRAKTIDGVAWEPKTKRNRAVPVSSSLRLYLDKWKLKAGERAWLSRAPKEALGPGQLLVRPSWRERDSEAPVGMPGLPAHVRESARHEGREPLQDFGGDGA